MNGQIQCPRCGIAITSEMRFCSACGTKLLGRSKGFIRGVLLTAAVLLLCGVGLQLAVQGKAARPAAARGGAGQQGSGIEPDDAGNPQLAAMRQQVESSPGDLTKLKMFAGMLGDALRSNPSAPPALVFEAIDVFGRILQQEPNDPAALVMMADVSFDQRAFTKALDFYERYLKVDQNDLGARSRYASTLTFLGRYDDSIRELGKVLQSEPKNFPAMAYLAITYAQKGDIATAKKIGGDALAAAPSEDARARFSSFVESLDQAKSEGNVGSVKQPEESVSGQPEAEVSRQAVKAGGMDGFVATLRSNPVAGPKFVRYEQVGATLKLYYREFPMSQMPPFAKDKFLGGIKSALVQNGLAGVNEVVFTDAVSQSAMETLLIASK
jgi:tetratricopeptide (TPR) repeat protein